MNRSSLDLLRIILALPPIRALIPLCLAALLNLGLSSCSSSVNPNPAAAPPGGDESAEGQDGGHALHIRLAPRNSIKIYYQRDEWRDLALNIGRVVKQSHRNFRRLFQSLPAFSISLALVDRDLFHLKTDSPDWIHAVYHKGKIYVPLSPGDSIDYYRLYRSLRHEYSHAVIDALAGGRCPGWIDEGFAQWAEGEPEPASERLLAAWLFARKPIPLAWLRGGFLVLQEQYAKIGYAQSRMAAEDLLQTYGVHPFRLYFRDLRNGVQSEKAFLDRFGLRPQEYEKRLNIKMERWASGFRGHS